MHDPRIGRFFAVDPLAAKYPWNSSYSFQENKIGLGRELEGLELDQSAKYQGYFKWTSSLGLSHSEAVEGIAEGYAYGLMAAGGGVICLAGGELFIPWAVSSIYSNPLLLNEASAFVWGLFIDEEYPVPSVGDNASKRIRKTAVGLIGEYSDDFIEYSLKGVVNGQTVDGLFQGSASLNKGVLELDFKVIDELQGKGMGTEMFNDIFEKFGKENIDAIKGRWFTDIMYSSGASNNLIEFNKAILEGKSPIEAVFSTPTGKWVQSQGYTNVQFDGNIDWSDNGTANDIILMFYK